MNIAKIMIPKVCTVFIHEDDTVRQGIEVMKRHGYTAIPVLDPGERYIGCLSDSDILRHVLEAGTTDLKEHEKYRIKDYSAAISALRSAFRRISTRSPTRFCVRILSRSSMTGIISAGSSQDAR